MLLAGKMPRRSKCRKRFVPYAKGFKAPSDNDRIQAIGDAAINWREFNPNLVLNRFRFFKPVPRPTDIDDWLAQYAVKGQTFKQYIENCHWLAKNNDRNSSLLSEGKIYLLPIGNFSEDHCVNFEDLAKFCRTYIGLPVIFLSPVLLEISHDEQVVYWLNETSDDAYNATSHKIKVKLDIRYNRDNQHYQLAVDHVLQILKERKSSDAISLIGLTMSDLYGGDTDLFVSGMARGGAGVAIFSFYRYDPTLKFSIGDWYDVEHVKPKKMKASDRKLTIFQRSCKLVVHEICHILGIAHCIYYDCCMNGSGHLAEDFR